MKYNPAKYHRRSIRLKEYDYSRSQAYFVTICINQGLHTLGEIPVSDDRIKGDRRGLPDKLQARSPPNL